MPHPGGARAASIQRRPGTQPSKQQSEDLRRDGPSLRWRLRWSFLNCHLAHISSLERQRPAGCWSEMATDDDD